MRPIRLRVRHGDEEVILCGIVVALVVLGLLLWGWALLSVASARELQDIREQSVRIRV